MSIQSVSRVPSVDNERNAIWSAICAAVIRFAIVATIAAASVVVAHSRNIMIVAPHPDDETLTTGGIIRAAVLNGDNVLVVVVTNGDVNGVSQGTIRQGETIAAMNYLGVASQNVIFLGYGDSLLGTLYSSTSPTTVYTSPANQTQTYASLGRHNTDFHNDVFGSHGAYNRVTILQDIRTVLDQNRPDDIYTTSLYDYHYDHEATYLFVVEALMALRPLGYGPRLHQTIIHPPCGTCDWPMPSFTPTTPFAMPTGLDTTPLTWGEIENVPVPASMQDPSFTTNMKAIAIGKYNTQVSTWLYAFVKQNEFFWLQDFSKNLALTAQVTVSTENTSTGQLGIRTIDGVVAGHPFLYQKEWASVWELAGAWIRYTWPAPIQVSSVVLHDRPNSTDQVLAGNLQFSDGSTVQVGTLPNGANGLSVPFTPRTVTWVQFNVSNAVGSNVGLAEVEIYGPSSQTVGLSQVTVNPASVVGGNPATGTVTLTGQAPASGVSVALSSNNAAAAVPASVTVTSGNSTATFTVTTTAVTTAATATITGTYNSVSKTAALGITPAVALAQVALNPTSVVGGAPSTGTVTLTGAAPAGGIVVALSSDNASATVPVNVTVLSGSSTATFTVSTTSVVNATTATITASYSTVSKTAPLAITPAVALSSVSLNPTSVVGGSPSTGTVTLSGPAPAAGIVVALSSDRAAAAFRLVLRLRVATLRLRSL